LGQSLQFLQKGQVPQNMPEAKILKGRFPQNITKKSSRLQKNNKSRLPHFFHYQNSWRLAQASQPQQIPTNFSFYISFAFIHSFIQLQSTTIQAFNARLASPRLAFTISHFLKAISSIINFLQLHLYFASRSIHAASHCNLTLAKWRKQ
jgi:hypothetical protein